MVSPLCWHVCVCLCLLSVELLNHFADFHETWYESDDVIDHLSAALSITR
jgi:hypothetical protein